MRTPGQIAHDFFGNVGRCWVDLTDEHREAWEYSAATFMLALRIELASVVVAPDQKEKSNDIEMG
jgi:hypothetical protein